MCSYPASQIYESAIVSDIMASVARQAIFIFKLLIIRDMMLWKADVEFL